MRVVVKLNTTARSYFMSTYKKEGRRAGPEPRQQVGRS